MPRSTIASRAHAAIAAVFRPGVHRRYRLSLESLERRDCPAVVAVVGGGTIAEGGESQLLTIRLSAPATKAVKVGYQITGHSSIRAVDTADYRLTVGATGLAGPSGSIEFRPGETVKQVRVAAVDDAVREGTESLRFTLFRPVGCTINAASSGVDISVLDNDAYTAAIVPQGPSRIAEGAAAPFVIELSSPATRAETFFVSTQDGTATTADYRPLRDMPVTILAGQQRSQPFSLNTVVDSNNAETDEYFLVTARPRSADMPAMESAGVTIRGTGPAPLTVAVSSPSVVEGNAGFTACTFTVTLSAPALDPIVVQYATADGTASAGVDYVASAGSLTFARGQISKTVTVNVIGDTVVEENETFQLIATVADIGATASGTGTILNDDSAFQITLSFVDTPLGPVPEGVRQLAREAAARWSKIIVGELPNVTLPSGKVIDDFELTVQMGLLGDADGTDPITLANAMPTDFRNGPAGLPYAGITGLDPADVVNVATPAQRQYVLDIITHELGHALGFGAGYKPFDPWVVGNTFVGPNAVAEYRSTFGVTSSSVPLQAAVRGHWDEEIFGDELMTPIAARPGTSMFISRVTVAAFKDMGYEVNMLAAEPYRLNTGAISAARARSVDLAAAASFSREQQRTKPTLRAASFAAFS